MRSYIVEGWEDKQYFYVCAKHKQQAMSMALSILEEHQMDVALDKGWPQLKHVTELERDEHTVTIIE